MNEQQLIDKLRRIEALFAGAATAGERDAAVEACKRISDRLKALEATDPPIHMRFSLPDPWKRQLFVALARRYALRPYRESGQHRSSMMLHVSERFVNDTLWPEFLELGNVLHGYLEEVTARVLKTVVHEDPSGRPARTCPPPCRLPARLRRPSHVGPSLRASKESDRAGLQAEARIGLSNAAYRRRPLRRMAWRNHMRYTSNRGFSGKDARLVDYEDYH